MERDPVLRRLEVLSDTVFGVAMTLLAYDLPGPDPHAAAPALSALLAAERPHLLALGLSFVIAGLFWLSHHRRLALAPRAGFGVMPLTFAFLLAVVALPVSTNFYGTFDRAGGVLVLYTWHLWLIASLHLLLWVMTLREAVAATTPGASWWRLVGPGFSFAVLGGAALLALARPAAADHLLFVAFLTPLVERPFRRFLAASPR